MQFLLMLCLTHAPISAYFYILIILIYLNRIPVN